MKKALAGLLGFLSCIFLAIEAVAAPVSSQIYGSLPSFETASLSSSGERIAAAVTVGGKRQVVVIDKDSKLIANLGLGGDKLRRIGWAGDDYVLLWISNTAPLGIGFTAAKIELTGVLVWDLAAKQTWQVFDKSNVTGGVRGSYGIQKRDGRWFGYFSGITLEKNLDQSDRLGDTTPELYEVDLKARTAQRIARRRGDLFQDWLVGKDGKVAARMEFRSKDGAWRMVNAEGKEIVSGRNPQGGVNLLGQGSRSGTVLYEQQNESTGETQWFEIPLSGGEPVAVMENESLDDAIFDPYSRRLIGYVEGGDHPAAHFFEPWREQLVGRVYKAFPDRTVSVIDWDDGFDFLLVRTDGNRDPGTWWFIDTTSGAANKFGQSYPLKPEQVGEIKVVQYQAADGLQMSGVLTLPPAGEAKHLPAVVFPHGGPAARDYPVFDWWAQALAAHGYAVFQPNFRGSTGFGAAFERAGHGEWGRKMQTDISDGLAELVRQGIVDPKRVCIMGASYGGYAALAGVTLQQGQYRCAVSVGGVSDVAEMYAADMRSSGYDQTLRRALQQQVGSGRSLKEVSPVQFAGRVDAPVLLIHGKDDTVVWYDQSKRMERALRAANKPVELVTLEGEDHWMSKSATRLAMLEAVIAFVQRHNPADAD